MFELLPESDAATANAKRSGHRILFVTSDKFPPFRPAAKALFADGLAAGGDRIDWVMQAADGTATAGIRRYRGGVACVAATHDGASRLRRLRKYWLDIRNDFRVFALLKRRRYSLVQIKDKYFGALIALAAARWHGVPAVYWLAYPHGEAAIYASRTGVARYRWLYALRGRAQTWLLYKIILPACTHAFVQSEQMRSDIAREGISLRKMTPVPSSVKLDDLDAAAAGRVSLHPRTVVYLGTLLRERRLDFLVRVHDLVRRRVPDARLLFVGRGETPEDEKLLWDEAERLGVEGSIDITGWLSVEAARRQVAAAAVCVSPYYPVPILLSTSPTKLIEYMALGRPVVGSDHPEQSEIIRLSGAGYVRAWDESEFADALITLLHNPEDAAAMGCAGRRFVEQFRTHTAMIDVVRDRYDRIIGDNREPGLEARLHSANSSTGGR